MARVTVSIVFDAESAAEAKKEIESWGLAEGTQVHASMQQEVGEPGATSINAQGKLERVAPPPPEASP